MSSSDSNIGKQFGRLTALALTRRVGYVKVYLWQCDCGGLREARLGNVQSLQTVSCSACSKGSLTKAVSTHGLSHTQLYRCWSGMKTRINGTCYPSYRNRTYCPTWELFELFYSDMKDSYFEGAVLDRIDNTKGYSKDNCQWLTKSEHAYKTWEERRNGK